MRLWLTRHDFAAGAIVPVPILHRLTRDWYEDRLDPAWQPRTPEEATARFERAGLGGSFWDPT
ncbi:MAG: hypothetical protein ABFS34_00920 [Gemmatimonadota bacterium]